MTPSKSGKGTSGPQFRPEPERLNLAAAAPASSAAACASGVACVGWVAQNVNRKAEAGLASAEAYLVHGARHSRLPKADEWLLEEFWRVRNLPRLLHALK